MSAPAVRRRFVRWLPRAKRPGFFLLAARVAFLASSNMLENGADIRFIQQLLGHEKLDTTAIYTEVSIKQLQEVHARCHPSARSPEPPPQPVIESQP